MQKYKVQSKIILNGFLYKEPKINCDKSAELLFKIPVYDKQTIQGKENENKLLYSSIYCVEVPTELWKSLKGISSFSCFRIVGKVRCNMSKKGIPFIIVYCERITLNNLPKNDNVDYLIEYSGMKKKQKTKKNKDVVQYKSNEIKKEIKYIWTYDVSNSQSIEVNNIILTEKEHLKNIDKGFYLGNRDINNPIVARRIDNSDKYSLVLGFATYCKAKIYNFDKIKAIITDFSRDEFQDKYRKELI